MLTVAPFYAAADRALAAELAAFLERSTGFQVYLEEGEVPPWDTLLGKVGRKGPEAEAILVLASPDSAPARWLRSEWEPVFWTEPRELGSRLAVVECRECGVPGLLKHRDFFRLTENRRADFRAIKAWLLGHKEPVQSPAEMEPLAQAVADLPGMADVPDVASARAFARAHGGAFEAVVEVDCRGRTVAGMAGDMAAQLQMPAAGPLEENLAALGRFCRGHRCLFLLDGGGRELVEGGVSSALVAPGEPLEVDIQAARASEDPAVVRRAFDRVLGTDWELARELGRRALRVARAAERLAEAFEVAEVLSAAAEGPGDRRLLDECAWERSWILERWGRSEEAAALDEKRRREYSEQIAFDFESPGLLN